MTILLKKAEGPLISFTSSNDKIHVEITEATNGPLFKFSDGSQLQFTDMLQYYKVITDKTIFNVNDQSFDIDRFKTKYFVDSDDVDLLDIMQVEEYRVNDKNAYRYIIY